MSPRRLSRVPSILAVFLLVQLVAGGSRCRAGDPLLYYVEEGRIVVTNTPGHRDARPVFKRTVSVSPRAATPLPATPYDRLVARVVMDPLALCRSASFG